MDVRKMMAGHEIDLLVAEKFNLFTASPVPGDWDASKNDRFRYVPQFSTSIAAAWTLLDAVTTEVVLVLDDWAIRDSEKWICKIRNVATYARTAPLAICRAALLLVESE